MGEERTLQERAGSALPKPSRCGAAQRAEQAALFNRCFRKQVDARALAWRYDRNPRGASLTLLARDGEGRALGGYACNARRALAWGDPASDALIGETGDVMTAPEARGRGVFSALDRACMEEARRAGWPLVFGLPNHRSAPIFLRLGWESLGACRAWTLVLEAGGAVREELRADGRLAALRGGFDAARARRAASRAARRAVDRPVEPLDAFPSAVAEISAAVERRFALMVRREADYLTWRFLEGPSGLHRSLGLPGARGSDFAGYATVQVPRAGEVVGHLVDLLAREDAEVERLALAALEVLREAGAGLVRATAVDGSWWSRRLAALGFRPAPDRRAMHVIAHVNDPSHPLAAALRPAARWYLTDGDRDDETVG